MSTTIVPPQETPAFDAKLHIAQRNAAEVARREGKVAPVVEAPQGPATKLTISNPPALEGEAQPARQSRSLRRLERQLGEERGLRLALEEQLRARAVEPATQPKAEEDPEPKRVQFQSDAEYNRALGRWDARQEAAKVLKRDKEAAGNTEAQLEFERQAAESSEKAKEDIKLLPDWDKVQKEAAEDEDAPEFRTEEHPTLMALIATSDVQAAVLYWLAKNPKDMQSLLDLTPKPADQIQKFRRLEGRAERLYTTSQQEQQNRPAQGSEPEKAEKDRKHPADEGNPSGRNGKSAAELDALKPRPTSEVAARGGSAPPEIPKIGTKAWMDARNAATHLPSR